MKHISIGLDIGSTTIKAVVIDDKFQVIFHKYERHKALIREKILNILEEIREKEGDTEVSLTITGSIGMGVAERYKFPFVQEVVAANKYVRHFHPDTRTMIDIGGEDAKVVFFENKEATNLRMNGNCAGGTGSFIDQMAILLGISNEDLDDLAQKAGRIYPIASRCGVFCKTDIQNLIAKNVSKEDIAASIFHAVAVQTVMTLSHGCDINPPILFCGGPLTFLPALRKAFIDYLHLEESDIVLPTDSNMIPAWGAALYGTGGKEKDWCSLLSVTERIRDCRNTQFAGSDNLKPLFQNPQELQDWKEEKLANKLQTAELQPGEQEVYIGIDSGSTTTKILILNTDNSVLFSYYKPNNGNPIQTVRAGLELFQEQCGKTGISILVKGSCTTGYGEDLIKAAFRMEHGIIETIAHFLAAKRIKEDVSFILDIGGQDMKAIFVSQGVITHIEINEACSSGCGTFIETFAKSMGYSVTDFAEEACHAAHPCDLGTRCTVFMNSKVKQVLREGASVGDISSGLSYSVINNCLYKVLKIKDFRELGESIVVQGGTMHNNAVCRALEMLTGRKVFRSDRPELMGAYGAALYAKDHAHQTLLLKDILQGCDYETRHLTCKGCENKCVVNKYIFTGNHVFYSGNKCERVFNNAGTVQQQGVNPFEKKCRLLFDRPQTTPTEIPMTIGIPRVLNIYEEYPFWHTLFSECGIKVVLSDTLNYTQYERGVKYVMSDNICFPAKLCHSHILNLLEKKVDRIFFPYVVFERKDSGKNAFNCPIVSGYSDVLRNTMDTSVPIDSPAITFKDKKSLYKECAEYLLKFNIEEKTVRKAFSTALQKLEEYGKRIRSLQEDTYNRCKQENKLVILLAGRPYHTDPLIQHKVADMIASLGVDIITEDIVRDKDIDISDTHFLSQWSFPGRILKAAKWVATQEKNIQFVEMTSFGCGPDAFMLDEIHALLKRHGKSLTQLKLDDVCNIGSLKLRIRSLIDSLRLSLQGNEKSLFQPFVTTPVFDKKEALVRKKILVPYFTPFISPLIPSFMKLSGYDFEVLPMSDQVSGDLGLKYANNEVCYPATLIVGDLIKAFASGNYNPSSTAVAITQTGGQCRATNYISLIKKALVDAGFENVPVISLSFDGSNNQPGFHFKWKKIINIAVSTILYTDALAKMYYASLPRENKAGAADGLKEKFLTIAKSCIERNQSKELLHYIGVAAHEFNEICIDKETKKVGIVGEIFLKFHFYAQRGITQWLINHGIEVVPPLLMPFFLQAFVNIDVNNRTRVEQNRLPQWVRNSIYRIIQRKADKYDNACSSFRYYQPFDEIYQLAKNSENIISPNAQFGEGWLLPGEVATMALHGVRHVVSLQPFGCIANHIISKGMEKRFHQLYPNLKFLSLDFDSGVSDVNVTNRMLLLANDLLEEQGKDN